MGGVTQLRGHFGDRGPRVVAGAVSCCYHFWCRADGGRLSIGGNMIARAGTLLLTLSLCLGLLTLGPQRAAATPEGMQFGARVQARSGEDNQAAIQRYESTIGRKLDVVREFLAWNSEFPQSFHTWLRDTDHTMILSVRAKLANGQVIPWADIANAASGSALHNQAVAWADKLRDYGRPVYFAFNHEPESSASNQNGSDADYIAAWRKMHGIFAERGATNVKFIWIMTDYAFWVGPQARNDAKKWYPGDDYLEAMGADAYNWFTCRPGINNPWKTLEQIIKPFRDFGAAHPDEELWLAEWASAEDAARPDRKPAWIEEARALFKRPDYAQFHGISYFDYQGTSTCRWRIDSSAPTTTAFRAIAQDEFYGGPPTPPPTSDISFVAAASSNGNRLNHSVRIPAAVQAGDTLLLFLTANSSTVGGATPPGWTPVRTLDASGFSSRLWTREATSTDAGATAAVSTSAYTKSDLSVVAYRGTGDPPLDVHAALVDPATRSQYTAPSVTPTRAGDEIVVYWADKSSNNTGHTVPAALTKLAPTTTGSGGGKITATVAAMEAGPAGTPTGSFTATLTQPASRAAMYTIALGP